MNYKKIFCTKLLFLILYVFCFCNAHAQPKQLRFIPAPFVFRTPETGWGGGIGATYFYKANEKKTQNDTITRLSNLNCSVIYTQNKQVVTDFIWNVFTYQNKYYLRGIVDYAKYLDYFYGIGANVNPNEGEFFDYNRIILTNRTLRRLDDHWYAGIYYQYFKTYNVQPRKPDGLLNTLNPTGRQGSSISGLGINAFYDSRDNRFNAQKGKYLEILTAAYHPVLGSSHRFNYVRLDARTYQRILPKTTWATQLTADLNIGSVPFNRLADIGGQEISRGYLRGIYRDKYTVQTQTEVRFPIYKIITGAGFVSTAKVATAPNTIDFTNLKWAYGGGIRLLFNEKNRLALRLDAAFTPTNPKPQIYLSINEAF
jgi:hypothetical protein